MVVTPIGTLEPVAITFEGTVRAIDYNSIFNKRPCIQNMAAVTYHYVGSRFPMTTNTKIN